MHPEHGVITTGMHGGDKHPCCSVVENLEAASLKGTTTNHPIGCYEGSAWAEITAKHSAWSTCDSGHIRLTVPATGTPTLKRDVFDQDIAGDRRGEKCPIRFAR